MNTKTIIVTGGAGFIGSHLCDTLVTAGNRVICVDNFSSGSLKNIAHLKRMKNFVVQRADVRRLFVVKGRVDEIYNLACLASPVQYQRDPIGTWETSVLGVRNMLELARKKHARVLQASTSEVYGDPTEHPQRESYWGNVNPVGVRSCYDEGKRAGETLCFDYARVYGADIRVVRIFNTYGPRMAHDDGRVVSNFIVQALSGKSITVYGSGLQTRSFQYVDDVVRGIIAMMNKKNFMGPVNLGNPGEFTMKDLARKVLVLTKSKSKIVFAPLPHDDPRRRCPDISLAKKMLGWSPRVPLDEGLQKTIAYFRGAKK